MSSRFLAAALLASSAAMAQAPAEGPRMVIVQPGYPGSTKDAEGFLRRLSGYVEEKAGLRGLSGEYHNEEEPALKAVKGEGPGAAGRRPLFGVVSLGFYLKHRAALGLRPLLEAKPKDSFVLVTRAGDVKDLEGLKGQPVAGGPLHERDFLERIALRGKADPSSWDLKPTLRTSRTLRDLADRKKHRAVVLTGRDYRAFGELYRTKNLEKIWESEYYPPALLVAFGAGPEAAGPTAGGEEALERVKRAFSGLPRDPRGKEILETMAAEGFDEVPKVWLKEVEGRYDEPKDRSVRRAGDSEGDGRPRAEGK
ncbi:MAG: hypothetical protein HY721_04615 [Planctomycetes bacterium]|nr:hypothetical protein [Planctomycetota bacterium]